MRGIMLSVHMLPADHGDCLWVEYGEPQAPRVLLIDGGTTGTWKRLEQKIIAAQAERGGKLHIDAFIVTHVDADHIGGAIKLLEQVGPLGLSFGDVWFNGYDHLDDEFGGKQGEQLSTLIESWKLPWNKAFKGRSVVVPDTGALPVIDLPGLKLTLLSPTRDQLLKLKPKWESEVLKAGLTPGDAYEAVDVGQAKIDVDDDDVGDVLGEDLEEWAKTPFKPDKTEANGSSIAFLAEHGEKSVLFAADAHADVLLASLARMDPNMRPTLLDAFKVSHHGSRNNTSRELVEALPSKRYLISTNGNLFRHPHQEAIARLVVHGPKRTRLVFNCKSDFNEQWANATWAADWGYAAVFGATETGQLVSL
jgi:beta-lactamase superfamily II metal-dependent hydrolase